jgi:hypothetical protein
MPVNIKADSIDLDSMRKIMESHVDVTGAELVEVQINSNRDTMWVNVNGICLLRICKINNLTTTED